MTVTPARSSGLLGNAFGPALKLALGVIAFLACQLPAAALITPAATLSVSSGAVTAGTVVTLTANVHAAGGGPYGGQVAFCDASAPHCTDIHQVGVSALLAGYAYLKITPSPGTHSYKAIYLGNASYATSTSTGVPVSVSPLRATATSIVQNGSNGGIYSLLTAVSGGGPTSPTGTVSFLDTSNGNYVLGTAALGSGSAGLSLTSGTSCFLGSGSGASAIATGDFNRDGIPDFANADTSTNMLTVCLVHRDGTFTTLTQSLPASANSPNSLAVGDFNNDGIPDLMVGTSLNQPPNAAYLTLLQGNGDGTFTTKTTLAGAYTATSPAVGDFDGDGNLDVAFLGNDVSHSMLYVSRGNGDGTFAATTSIAQPQYTFYKSLFAADLNSDGRTDLVYTLQGSSSITVVLGGSGGAYTAKTPQTLVGVPSGSIAAADFNGDGNLDLAVAESGSISILTGNGDGTFSTGTPVSLPGPPSTIAAADVNGDGKADLAATLSITGNNVLVVAGNGDGTFSSTQVTGSVTYYGALAVGDFNADGFADLAVVNGDNASLVLANPGAAATATGSVPTPVGTGTHLVVASYAGDVNFAASVSGSSGLTASRISGQAFTLSASPASSVPGQAVTLSTAISPYAAQGHSTDGESVTFRTFPGGTAIGTGSLASGVATLSLSTLPAGTSTIQASYPGDGNFYSQVSNDLAYTVAATTATALAVTSGGSAVTSVAAGTAVTLTATVFSGSTPVTAGLVAFCDAAAAHCTDVHRVGTAQLTSAGTATLRLIAAIGSHSYRAVFVGTVAATTSSSGAASLAVTGLAATVTHLSSSGSPGNYTLAASVTSLSRVALSGTVSFVDTSNGNAVLGSATIPFSSATFALGSAQTIATGTQPKAVATGDFNGDGKPDFVVANYGASTLTVELGNGDGTFTAAASLSANLANPVAVAVGDFNGDGKMDIAAASYASGNVSVFLGNGDGSFTAGPSFVGATLPTAVVVGDFNDDGVADLAVASAYGDTVNVFVGQGNGSFTAGPSLTAGNYPTALVAADFNDDGVQDIAVANVTDRTITVFFGAGNGQFPTSRTLANVGSSYALATADLDGDGNADLVALDSGGNTVSILRGDGTGAFIALASPATATNPVAVAVGDLNGDGIPDLVTANNNGGTTLDVFFGNGDGTFQAATGYATGIVPQALALADFNGDGSGDPVTANYAGGNASVLLAQTTQTAIVSASGISPAGSGTSHAVDAAYPGDSAHAGSTSNLVSLSPLPYAVAPGFSPAGGSYPSAQTVALTTSTAGATIFYTTDGSSPTISSRQYTAPLTVAASETVNAIASAPNYQNSAVSSAAYTINYPPTITAQPGSQTINSGGTATLSVGATSATTPLAYQWYSGVSPSTAAPIAGATSATYTTPALAATSSYWVQVNNASAVPANSNTATITVNTPPTITTQPASQTINSGATATLAVTATGSTPLQYQWYAGVSPGTASPIAGANGPTYMTPALTATSNFWVQVSNSSGVVANSATATIIVVTAPAITGQTPNPTINTGQSATLAVSATGSSPAYQWFSGASPNTAAPIAGATFASYMTPLLTASSSFWVQVSNAAGRANSATFAVTVLQAPSCTLAVQPTTTSLTVVATSRCSDPQGLALTSQTISWGDGTASTVNLSTSTNTHTYTAAGIYTVTVSATSASGLTGSATQRVSPNQSPVCTLGVVQGQISNVLTQYPVTVAAGCTDPQGQALTLSLDWGDGTVVVPPGAPPYAHTYSSATTVIYNVVLTATDSSGLSGSSAPQPVQIVPAQPIPAGGSTPVASTIPPPPTPPPTPLQVTFLCSSVSVQVNGQTVTTLPSSYGISCTSPSVPLTSAPIPVNVTITTSNGAVASVREPPPVSAVALCGLAFPFVGGTLLLPLVPARRRRRLGALGLACILCLSLSACGGSFQAPATAATPSGLYYITLVETVVNPPAPTGFVQTSLIVPLPVTH